MDTFETAVPRVARFEARKDKVHPLHGVFDTVDNTWHEGDHDDATYAAGVPMWKKKARAEAVASELNGRLVYVVEEYVEDQVTQIVGVSLTLDGALVLGDKALPEQYGDDRGFDVVWREGTTWNPCDHDTKLRTWSAHRPASSLMMGGTYLFVDVTEYLLG